MSNENNTEPKEKSPMYEWAEHEIELACARERTCCVANDAISTDFDYGCGCYGSAFKAYKSLLEDGHSGMSISITKNILNRLIDHKPLTAIEDVPEVWTDVSYQDDEKMYQCKRMSSLFKYVYPDGRVEYSDIESYTCFDVGSSVGYYNGSTIIKDIVYGLQPITFPYYPPSKPIKVYTETLLTDRVNGDFDTKGILYLIMPNGDRVDVNKFMKADNEDPDWIEITESQYESRRFMHNNRRLNEFLDHIRNEYEEFKELHKVTDLEDDDLCDNVFKFAFYRSIINFVESNGYEDLTKVEWFKYIDKLSKLTSPLSLLYDHYIHHEGLRANDNVGIGNIIVDFMSSEEE